MKIKLNVLLNAPNDFKCGDCKKCPIHQESYFSTHQYEDIKINCPLGYNSVSCPLELQSESEDKPYIKGDYYDGFKNGLRTSEWRYDKIRAEIEALDYLNIEDGSDGYDKYIEQYEVLKIVDKYKAGK